MGIITDMGMSGSDGNIVEKVAELERACRRNGLPVTPQRRVIMETLAARTDHPTAEMVYGEVRGLMPGVSRTTVYRVLDLFVRLSVAARICSPTAIARYDAQSRPHHHAICRDCGRVTDLHAPDLDGISLPAEMVEGMLISGYAVNLIGICADCHPSKRRPPT